MPTVAKLAIKIEADAKSATRSLDQTTSKAKRTQGAIEDLGDEALESRKDVASLSISLDQAGGALGKVVAVLGGLVAAKAAFDVFKSGAAIVAESNAELRENAFALGLSTETLSGWASAAASAGTSLSAVASASTSLGATIQEAITTPGGEADLALEGLGLSAAALAGLSPEEQLKAAADGFSKTAAGALKAADAEKVFGGNAGELRELLSGGSEALTQGQADADAFGTALSAVESDQIQEASTSLNRLWEVGKGVAITVGKELAPYIKFAADQLIGFATGSDLAKNAGKTASLILVEGARFIGDAWDGASIAITDFMQGVRLIGITTADVALPAIRAVLSAIDAVRGTNYADAVTKQITDIRNEMAIAGNKALKWKEDMAARPKTTGDELAAEMERIGKAAAAAAQNQGTLTTALVETGKAGMDAGRNLNQSKINEYLQGLKEEVDGFGASKADEAASAIAKLGGSASEQAQAAGLAQYAEDLEAAKKVMEELETPTAKYEERLGELSRLLEQGVIDQEAFDGAASKAKKDLDSARKVDPTRRPTAALEGSAEALKAVRDYRARSQGREEGPAKQLKLQQEQVKLQQEELAALKTIAANPGFKFEVVAL